MNFCTYFDCNYIHKGIACINTLHSYCKDVCVYVLCFDEKSERAVEKINNTIIIRLIDLENYYPELKKAKQTRDFKEYYATMSPILPLFIFDVYKISSLFYTDSDIAFFSSAKEIEDVFANYSIMITPHENPETFDAGRFNVGILGYRNDDNCKEFLNWWKDKCLTCCSWCVSECGFADQGYLDIFHTNPGKFKNFFICDHCGINLGPWNVSLHKFNKKNDKMTIDDKNLICYHFHRFDESTGKSLKNTAWVISDDFINSVYKTYFDILLKTKHGDIL